MFELQCADNVKELWHDVCKAVIMERLPTLSKVCIKQKLMHG